LKSLYTIYKIIILEHHNIVLQIVLSRSNLQWMGRSIENRNISPATDAQHRSDHNPPLPFFNPQNIRLNKQLLLMLYM